MEDFLVSLEQKPMKELRFMIKYENCRRVSIKAIHSPIDEGSNRIRTRILEENTHLKINEKKINLRGTL